MRNGARVGQQALHVTGIQGDAQLRLAGSSQLRDQLADLMMQIGMASRERCGRAVAGYYSMK